MSNSPVFQHPLLLTSLERNAFAVLGATTRDTRRTILHLAEEKSLIFDPQMCADARQQLTNPKMRLSAEIAWLPGIAPALATSLLQLLRKDLATLLHEATDEVLPHPYSPLPSSNLIVAAIELFDESTPTGYWVEWIVELALQDDVICAEYVRVLINNDRAVAGFPEIPSWEPVNEELRKQLRSYHRTIREAMGRLTKPKMLDIVRCTVDRATGMAGTLTLIDELVDNFEVDMRSTLEEKSRRIEDIIGSIQGILPFRLTDASELLSRLERVLLDWGQEVRPIQIRRKERGMDHVESRELCYKVRDAAINMFNKYSMIEEARRITKVMREVFAEVPELVEILDDDTETLDAALRHRKEAKEWEHQITYEDEIDFVSKQKLKISPHAIE